MVKKSTFLSIIAQRKSNSVYKTGIWLASLVFMGLLGLHSLSVAVFLLVSLGLFLSLPSGRADFWATYWVFAVSSGLLLLLQKESSFSVLSSFWISLVICLISAVIFFFILELIDYAFVDRFLGFSLINTGVFAFLFMSVMALASPFYLAGAGIYLFLALFLIFREILGFSGSSGRKSLVLGLVFGLLGLELAWIVLSLPVGILNGAALLTLFFVIIREFLAAHSRGSLTTQFAFRQFTFLVLFMIIILAASQWAL